MSTVHKSSKSPLDLNNVQYYYTELLFKKKEEKKLGHAAKGCGVDSNPGQQLSAV